MSKLPEQPMRYCRALKIIGNGDLGRGKQLIFMLARRLEEARRKHPLFAEGPYQALGVIGAAYRELVLAIEHETPDRQLDEALNMAGKLMRFVNGEHLLPGSRRRG